MAGYDTVTVGGSPMKICVSKPAGAGPSPAVLLMFHRAGIDEFTRDRADRLAVAGFIAAAPDLFHRSGEEVENPMTVLDDKELAADIAAAVDHIKGMAESDGRFAIMGHCMGGRVAFLGASVNPAFQAAVIFYSGNMFKPWGEGNKPPFELLGGLKGRVIGFFGNDDKNPSPEDVDRIDAELGRLGIAHEFHRYDGAGHAFQNFVRPDQYREGPEKDSWARTLEFLKKEFA